MRIALGLEYDGSAFLGWQTQAEGVTVQGVLEKAIASIAGHPVRVHAAGRTDTGVHALMQVVHFETEAKRPYSAWVRGVNAHLPPAVRVLWAKQVSDEFHARFSAHGRSYQYLLVNTPVAPAIGRLQAGWYHRPLNSQVMQTAAAYLLGEHDFSAFRASECQAKTPVKAMQRAEVSQMGDMFLFEFSANAFLQHQVRNMVGALVYAGNGKHPPEFIKDLLNQKDRTLSPPTFSPNGLYLCGVHYDEKWGLPSTQRSIAKTRMDIGL
jgi:tRNA pseudouridine38-40 synthase